MGIPEVNLISALPAPASSSDNASVAVEFDAMLWELLLRESGIANALGGEDGAETSLYGEIFVKDLARQLATQIDVGFGRLVLAQSTSNNTEGVRHE